MVTLISKGMRVEALEPHTLSEVTSAAYAVFKNRLLAEAWPDDAPWSVEKTVRRLRAKPSYVERPIWAVWHGDAIVAVGEMWIRHVEDNRHLADFNINVLPEMRRQGLARTLLARIVEVAASEKRSLLVAVTDSVVPAGEAFMDRLGARRATDGHVNQLDLGDLDRSLLRTWQDRVQERAVGFDLCFWEGACPETDLVSFAHLLEITLNDEPWDELEVEARNVGPERLREFEASLLRGGRELWTLAARHRQTGELVGYTTVDWEADEPETLQQGGTGVLPEFRNLGLGRWLKAAMLERVLYEKPRIKRIRTGNADSNAAMLTINQALGFKPYKANTFWQVGLDQVRAFFARK